jgi:DNA polymerase I-like protein with 3'-5' exonuclease and polymerase domains
MADIERKPAKTINLGLTYGMGKKKLAEQLNLTLKEANVLFDKYHDALPYIKALTDKSSKLAGQRGFVKTILGRRCHFDLWGPPRWSAGMVPKKFDEAVKEFGRPVQRYFLHKALNRIIQGSSADMIKVALVLCRRAGYIPHLTVHDENDYSIENRKQAKEIHDIMVYDTAKFLGLSVPLKVDCEIGPNWGECGKDASIFDKAQYDKFVQEFIRKMDLVEEVEV